MIFRSLKIAALLVLLFPAISLSQDEFFVEDSEPELLGGDSGTVFDVPEQYKKENSGFLDLLFGGADSEQSKAMEDAVKTSPVEGVGEEVEVVEDSENGSFNNTAVLAIIDKTLGKKYTASIKVGNEYYVKKLVVKPISCWKPNVQTLLNESKSLVDIKELHSDDRQKRLFYGWIMANNQSSSLLEHEEYDIILLNCKNN